MLNVPTEPSDTEAPPADALPVAPAAEAPAPSPTPTEPAAGDQPPNKGELPTDLADTVVAQVQSGHIRPDNAAVAAVSLNEAFGHDSIDRVLAYTKSVFDWVRRSRPA